MTQKRFCRPQAECSKGAPDVGVPAIQHGHSRAHEMGTGTDALHLDILGGQHG